MEAGQDFHPEMRLQNVGLISQHLKDDVEEEVDFPISVEEIICEQGSSVIIF